MSRPGTNDGFGCFVMAVVASVISITVIMAATNEKETEKPSEDIKSLTDRNAKRLAERMKSEGLVRPREAVEAATKTPDQLRVQHGLLFVTTGTMSGSPDRSFIINPRMISTAKERLEGGYWVIEVSLQGSTEKFEIVGYRLDSLMRDWLVANEDSKPSTPTDTPKETVP